MTFRERCALAAMREEFRDSLRGSRGLERNYHANIAHEAWLFADAMEAERAKRQPPESDGSVRIAELQAFTAELQRVATTLDGPAPDGPCDDTCGCTTDGAGTTGMSTVATRNRSARHRARPVPENLTGSSR